MAVGKNKKMGKKGKGKRKKVVDSFAKKSWYAVRYPKKLGKVERVGWTCVNKTSGNFNEEEGLKGRVFEANFADLAGGSSSDLKHKKIKLEALDVATDQRCVFTNVYGFDVTTDYKRQKIMKWLTVIDGVCDVKTVDGYLVRVSCTACTQKLEGQIRKTSYAKTAQTRILRKKMVEVINREVEKNTVLKLFEVLRTAHIGKAIKSACLYVYPLATCYIRKVKVLRKPDTKMDASGLAALRASNEERQEVQDPEAMEAEMLERAPEDDA